MHSTLRIGDANIMLSDGYCKGSTNFSGVTLSLSVPNQAAADRAAAREVLGEDAGAAELELTGFERPGSGAVVSHDTDLPPSVDRSTACVASQRPVQHAGRGRANGLERGIFPADGDAHRTRRREAGSSTVPRPELRGTNHRRLKRAAVSWN